MRFSHARVARRVGRVRGKAGLDVKKDGMGWDGIHDSSGIRLACFDDCAWEGVGWLRHMGVEIMYETKRCCDFPK